MSVVVKEVVTRKDLKAFVLFPFRLYRNAPFWVPPLISDELSRLRKDKNPAFDYAEACYWLAYRGDTIVGRIAGIIHYGFIDKWGKKLARFGWVDFVDDAEVSSALFRTVEEWARSKGMEGTHGPLGFTDMDPEGLQITGFENLPTIANISNYPYYPEHFEKFGYVCDAEWIQYRINASQPVPDKVRRVNNVILSRYNLKLLRFHSVQELIARGREVFEVLNTSFAHLYGFVPLTDREIDFYIRQYFSYIRPEYVSIIADQTDRIVGFAVSMPSLSLAFRKARGRLFPFGIFHILRALRKNDTVDLYLEGVLPEWQSKGIVSLFFHDLNKTFIRDNIRYAISNQQLVNNLHAVSMWKNYEREEYFRRRCYVKPIGEA
jgi:hypothetical protein